MLLIVKWFSDGLEKTFNANREKEYKSWFKLGHCIEYVTRMMKDLVKFEYNVQT